MKSKEIQYTLRYEQLKNNEKQFNMVDLGGRIHRVHNPASSLLQQTRDFISRLLNVWRDK